MQHMKKLSHFLKNLVMKSLLKTSAPQCIFSIVTDGNMEPHRLAFVLVIFQ